MFSLIRWSRSDSKVLADQLQSLGQTHPAEEHHGRNGVAVLLAKTLVAEHRTLIGVDQSESVFAVRALGATMMPPVQQFARNPRDVLQDIDSPAAKGELDVLQLVTRLHAVRFAGAAH